MQVERSRNISTPQRKKRYPIDEICQTLLDSVYQYHDDETRDRLEALCHNIEWMSSNHMYDTDFIVDLLERLEIECMEDVLEIVKTKSKLLINLSN